MHVYSSLVCVNVFAKSVVVAKHQRTHANSLPLTAA
jgi:hypothetical protein